MTKIKKKKHVHKYVLIKKEVGCEIGSMGESIRCGEVGTFVCEKCLDKKLIEL